MYNSVQNIALINVVRASFKVIDRGVTLPKTCLPLSVPLGALSLLSFVCTKTNRSRYRYRYTTENEKLGIYWWFEQFYVTAGPLLHRSNEMHVTSISFGGPGASKWGIQDKRAYLVKIFYVQSVILAGHVWGTLLLKVRSRYRCSLLRRCNR